MAAKSTKKSKLLPALRYLKKTASKTLKEPKNKDNCLFIRYRHGKLPNRDEIRLLHPSIIDVRFPRQKSAKFCQLEFETKEAAIDALRNLRKTRKEELAVIQYLGRRTALKPPSVLVSTNSDVGTIQSESNTLDSDDQKETSVVAKEVLEDLMEVEPCSCLHVSGLPNLAVTEVIKNLYPTNTKVVLGDMNIKGKRCALVHFGSTEDAMRVKEASSDVSVNGERLMVRFHK